MQAPIFSNCNHQLLKLRRIAHRKRGTRKKGFGPMKRHMGRPRPLLASRIAIRHVKEPIDIYRENICGLVVPGSADDVTEKVGHYATGQGL
jgi:hypothetical protein